MNKIIKNTSIDSDKKKYYKKNENIAFREIENEIVLVPIGSGMEDMDYIYTLNETGSEIWKLIGDKRNFGDIEKIIADKYKIEVEKIRKDLISFFKQLKEIEAIF